MRSNIQEILEQINSMPVSEKLKIIDSILEQLDKPDPEIDNVWKNEAKKRWNAYKEGSIDTVSYNDVMGKYRNK